MKQLTVTETVLPAIHTNIAEVREDLDMALEKFRDITVTKDNLDDCAKAQKELAGVRRGIDEIRLKIKKEVIAPIDAFEDDMKSLITMVVGAEKPIKDGLKVFEDRRVVAATQEIMDMIDKGAEAVGLREEFRTFEIDPRWTNKTAKKVDVAYGIQNMIQARKNEQDLRDENVKAVNEMVDSANKANGLVTPLDAEPYISKLVAGAGLPALIKSINDDAARQKAAEARAADKVVSDGEGAEKPPTATPAPSATVSVDAITRTVRVEITGTDSQFTELADYLTAKRMPFKKLS